MLKAKSKFVKYGSEYSVAILVPAEIRKDSAFPFNEDQELEITLEKDKIVITKSQS